MQTDLSPIENLPVEAKRQSKISPLVLHIDVDAFFPSVEQLLIPPLRGRAVIVGSGVIASCSYEARRLGLHVGMSLREARRRCPQAVVLTGDYQIYRCFAEHVWEICRGYTCGLETYLDEAYGDAGGMERLHGQPPALGRRLQEHVRRDVGLPVSVGLAENRMLAKLASHAAKPGGVRWIAPGQVNAFLAALPVERLPGVGPRTTNKLHDMTIETVGELRRLSREALRAMFGCRGEVLYERARGRDVRPLGPVAMPKTISRETTFHRPTCDRGEILGMLFYLTERATRTVRQLGLLAGCVEVSIRYDDWREYRTRRTPALVTDDENVLFGHVRRMLQTLHTRRVALRHVGIVLSRFTPAGQVGRLFESPPAARRRGLHAAVDRIRDRWGHAAVVTGQSIDLLDRLEQNDYGFVLRTPSLTK